jgi:hypothetical protein
MRPILNPDNPPTGDMFTALNWLETLCRMRGQMEITEAEVVEHLAVAEGRPDLARAFATGYLLPQDGPE